MRSLLVPIFVLALAASITSCKSSSSAEAPKALCDTVCLQDTLKFSGDHKLSPYIYITVKGCKPDSIIWSYKGMGTNRKTKFEWPDAWVNKDFIRCVFKDTGYAYILFNDCVTSRGYQMKIPFNKNQSFQNIKSAINNIDPKFSIGDNLFAYTDRGKIYVEEIATGKKAMMTFGEKLDIDYDAIHEYIDSVNISNQRIWVKVKIKDQWKEIEKTITLE
jgi:hypothetical protein